MNYDVGSTTVIIIFFFIMILSLLNSVDCKPGIFLSNPSFGLSSVIKVISEACR